MNAAMLPTLRVTDTGLAVNNRSVETVNVATALVAEP